VIAEWQANGRRLPQQGDRGLPSLTINELVLAYWKHAEQHCRHPDGTPTAEVHERMLKKLNQSLAEDIAPLLPAGVDFTDDDAIAAFGKVWRELITRIPGDSWKSSQAVIEAMRKAKISALLSGVQE
jgi:hypothetical protein